MNRVIIYARVSTREQNIDMQIIDLRAYAKARGLEIVQEELINALEEFKALGVDFISFKENIDTSSPAGKILFTMISAFAEFEREIIKERVRAGMEKAKAKGKVLGRPKIPPFTVKAVLELKRQGIGYKAICKKLGISKSTYYQIIKK